MQTARFLTVGGGATTIHAGTAIALNGLAGMSPLWSNFTAFLVAVSISYLANWFWTFDSASRHRDAMPRFAMLSLMCFAVNQSIVYAVVEWLAQPLWLAMIPVAIMVPALGFWLSRAWAFNPVAADA